MKTENQRNIDGKSITGIPSASLLTMVTMKTNPGNNFGKRFVHHVFFWLKNPENKNVRVKFEKALKELITIETIVEKHLGMPVSTTREVVDSTYTYSLFVAFRNKEDHDIYQSHPTHLKFIKDFEDLWERVVVYDAVSI